MFEGEKRKQREKEFGKSPLNSDEILTVFNEVPEEHGVSPIVQADVEVIQRNNKQQR